VSKAFTREDDAGDDGLPDVPEAELPLGAKNLITPEGARRLRAELDALTRRASGEPPDPALQRRLRVLSRRVQSFEVTAAPARPERVVFGTTVTVRDESDRERRYRLVGRDEADAAKGDLSWLSPLGGALLHARVGDVVTLHSPRGEEDLEVLRIE
jgi:transcription elongation factor GreB